MFFVLFLLFWYVLWFSQCPTIWSISVATEKKVYPLIYLIKETAVLSLYFLSPNQIQHVRIQIFLYFWHGDLRHFILATVMQLCLS